MLSNIAEQPGYKEPPTDLVIDKEQALAQLRILGYEKGDTVCFTHFLAKTHPRFKTDKGITHTAKFPRLPWQKLNNYQKQGYGVYFVVNQGGHLKKDITRPIALFYEHDRVDRAGMERLRQWFPNTEFRRDTEETKKEVYFVPLDVQRDIWKHYNLPRPSLQVETGGKSVHSYWTLTKGNEGVPKKWRAIQIALLCLVDGDRSLKNENRVMRLAGCFHQETWKQTLLVDCQRITYSLLGMEDSINKAWENLPKPEPKPTKEPIAKPINPIPGGDLSQFLHAVIYPRLLPEQWLTWQGHDWQVQTPEKWKGCCPWHDSKSGTSFYANPKDGVWWWMCAGCNVGGGALEYIDRLDGGNGKPKGKRFVDLVKRLADLAGVEMPERESSTLHPVVATPKGQLPPTTDNWEDAPELCSLAQNYRKIEKILGSRLRLNMRTKEMELDGEPLATNDLILRLALDHNCQVKPKDDYKVIFSGIARRWAYDPVQTYLTNVHNQAKGQFISIDNLAERWMSRPEPIFNVFVRKMLISAVARAFDPGCRVDTALILQSPTQGHYKTTFYETLAGKANYDGSGGKMSNKDELMKLHRAWMTEWSEVEQAFKRRDISDIKAFMSTCVDYFRAPYAETIEAYPRPSIVVGTTNEDDFLKDPTGDRRFWVIPLQQAIDIDAVQRERDQVWAAATHAYLQGGEYLWWLSPEEQQQSSEVNAQFQDLDPWESEILSWLQMGDVTTTTTTDILSYCLKFDLNQMGRREEMRVAQVMKRLGWTKRTQKFEGKRRRCWERSAEFSNSLNDLQKGRAGRYHPPESAAQRDFQESQPSQNRLLPSLPGGCDVVTTQPTQPQNGVVTEVVTPKSRPESASPEGGNNLHNLNQENLPQEIPSLQLQIGDACFAPCGRSIVQGVDQSGIYVGDTWEDAVIYAPSEVMICR